MEKIKKIISKIPIHNKKLLIIGAAVLCIVIISTVLVIVQNIQNRQAKNNDQQAQSTEKKPYFASLGFVDTELIVSSQNTQSAYVLIDVGANSLESVSFSIDYDPNAITEVHLAQELDNSSALSNSLTVSENFTDREKGISTISFTLKEGAFEQNGSGKIAKFSFKTSPGFKGGTKIELTNIKIGSKELSATEEFLPQTNNLVVKRQ